MKLRIGNTFNLKFTITSAGTPYDLRDKNLLLVVKNKIKNTEVILHCPAFSITGADHNVIFWTFQGNEQVYTGKYMLTLYENKGLDNMLAVDCCDAFELVNCSCDTDNETSCGNVEVETIELAADVLISGRMVQSDYSVTDPTDPAYIRNKPTLGTLAEKSVVDITDINATGTPSSSTTLHGDGTWKASGVGAANWGSIGGDISSQTDLKNALDGKVNNSQVQTDVPVNAKFTDTTYSEITETEINAGTASTLRTITARRITFVLSKVGTMISNAMSALTKSDIGLSNVDNVQQIPMSQKGANNGVAELDASGKVLSNQLPSFVDDVLEFDKLVDFPTTGEAGKIYVATSTNLTYRWSGSGYVEISPSLALGETSSTAYRGDRGKIAYNHSQSAHAPSDAQKNSDITKAEIEAKLTGKISTHSHSVSKADVGLSNVDNTSDADKPISTATQSALDLKSNITSPAFIGIPTAPTATKGNNTTQIATTAFVQEAMGDGGFGDMMKSVYDSNNSGVVDNAEKVNGYTVESNVPSGAVFTDTITTVNGKTGAIAKSDIVALGIPAQDTTYSTSTLEQLNAGSNTTGMLQTAKSLNDWLNDKGYITSYTDTTYTAGDGLTLSGTTFSLPITILGSGTYVQSVTQTANGLTITLGTPPDTNTTYSEISEAEINTGTSDTKRTITARRITYVLGKVTTTINSAISALTKSDIGLGNVDNTSDTDKPISTAVQNALDGKVNNSQVQTDVPAGAVFTDTITTINGKTGAIAKADIVALGIPGSDTNTTYDEISEAEINTGSASTLRTITARRIAFILGKVTTMINNAISALTKTDVGLSNVDNVKQIPLSQKGSNNGVAELDANGKVPANQLPSFVDDVLEFANLASFPQPGEADKIYVDKATNKTYRWGGSGYVQLNEGVVLGETNTTAYRGDRGKIAYDHSQATHAPSDAQKNSDITKAEIEAKLTGDISTHTHSSYVPTSRTVAGKALTSNITLTKGDVGLGNVDNVQQASKTEFDSHNSDAVKHITAAERSSWNAKLDANKIVVVTELPASPDPDTFYFIEE